MADVTNEQLAEQLKAVQTALNHTNEQLDSYQKLVSAVLPPLQQLEVETLARDFNRRGSAAFQDFNNKRKKNQSIRQSGR